jgi:hypothetical protein
MKSKVLKYFMLMLLLGISLRCTDEGNPVPIESVYLSLSLNSELANLGVSQLALLTPDSNNYVQVTIASSKIPTYTLSGSNRIQGRGVVLYRSSFDTFYAFDATCTYVKEGYCTLDTTSWGSILKCPCCNSQFLIHDDGIAYPMNGSKASYSLRTYSAFLNGTNVIISSGY